MARQTDRNVDFEPARDWFRKRTCTHEEL